MIYDAEEMLLLSFLVVIVTMLVPVSARIPATAITGGPNEAVQPVCMKIMTDTRAKTLEASVITFGATLLPV
jgi:hypothetical protein